MNTFEYGNSIQGWGLCNDGEYIYKSDGTNKIWLLDKETLEEVSYIEGKSSNPMCRRTVCKLFCIFTFYLISASLLFIELIAESSSGKTCISFNQYFFASALSPFFSAKSPAIKRPSGLS